MVSVKQFSCSQGLTPISGRLRFPLQHRWVPKFLLRAGVPACDTGIPTPKPSSNRRWGRRQVPIFMVLLFSLQLGTCERGSRLSAFSFWLKKMGLANLQSASVNDRLGLQLTGRAQKIIAKIYGKSQKKLQKKHVKLASVCAVCMAIADLAVLKSCCSVAQP